jgi:hypothetical protein
MCKTARTDCFRSVQNVAILGGLWVWFWVCKHGTKKHPNRSSWQHHWQVKYKIVVTPILLFGCWNRDWNVMLNWGATPTTPHPSQTSVVVRLRAAAIMAAMIEVGLDHCHGRMRPDTEPAVTVPSGTVRTGEASETLTRVPCACAQISLLTLSLAS